MHTSKADLGLMRELNEQIVLSLLRQEAKISRAELARRSNLSRSTVSSIIAGLLASGLVRETGSGSSQGGRRPIMIEFNYQSSYVVGIEVGSTVLTVLVADLAAKVLRRVQRPFDITAGPHACIPQVVALVNQALAEAQIAREKTLGVGVGVPGSLASANGRLIALPMMPGWHDVSLRDLLEEALGLRAIVENDAKLGALAEHRWGAARGCHNVTYLYLGSAGIGCGLILEGRLYCGDVGLAGQIGHLIVEQHGPACRCGSSGCLEAVAGPPALLKRARALGLPCERIEDVIVLARQRNSKAVALIEAAGTGLGTLLVTLLRIINPGCIVIGGVLAAAGDLLLHSVQVILEPRGLAPAVSQVAIVPGALGSDVVALGGVAAIVRQALGVPGAILRTDT